MSPFAPAPAPELIRDVAWQRLDPRMLLVHPVREAIRFLPALVAVVVAGRAAGGVWQLGIVALPVAVGLLRYLTTSFRIADGRVELRRGLLSRHTLATPLDRVRSVDLTASPIHRLLGLTTVRIGTGTASKDKDELLDLDGLPADRARELRRELLHLAAPSGPPGPSGPGTPLAAPADDLVLGFDVAWVRFAPLTSTGLVIVAAVLGGGFQLLDTFGVFQRLDPETWALAIPLPLTIGLAVVAAVLALALLSVVGYLVTNGGFRLTRGGGSFHVRRGLLTTRETSLAEERVAGIYLAEPLSLRLVGARQLTAIVTGLDRKERGGAMLVPPAPRDVVLATAARVLGVEAPTTSPLVEHGQAAVRRRWNRALVPAAVLAAAMLVPAVTLRAWWLLPLVLVVGAVAVLLAADRARTLGHALVAGHLVARSGSLLARREVLATEHVIGWTFRATWFQRRAGLTTLDATMAGGGQHLRVLDVPEADAVALAVAAVPGLVEQFTVETGTAR